MASSQGHTETVKALLCLGAHVHARDKFGHTPLRDALSQGHQVSIELLMLAGSHISQVEMEDLVHEAMKWAARGDVKRLEYCVNAGMDLNTPWIDGQTVLHVVSVFYIFVSVEVGLSSYV